MLTVQGRRVGCRPTTGGFRYCISSGWQYNQAMKRILRFIVVVVSVLGLCCTVAVVVGRSQSEPVLFSGLSQCDSGPCVLDIVPGKTAWIDARTRFQKPKNNIQVDVNDD